MASIEERVQALEDAVSVLAANAAAKSGQAAEVEGVVNVLRASDEDEQAAEDERQAISDAADAEAAATEAAAEEAQLQDVTDDSIELGASPEAASPDATQAAESLAQAAGVDLTSVPGPGVDGRILVDDVEDAAEGR